jgi:hypothetical protein
MALGRTEIAKHLNFGPRDYLPRRKPASLRRLGRLSSALVTLSDTEMLAGGVTVGDEMVMDVV